MCRRLLASTFAAIANAAALLDITQHLALVRATELRTVTAIPLRDVDDRWFAAWRLRLCLRWVSMPPAERKSPVAALTTDDRRGRTTASSVCSSCTPSVSPWAAPTWWWPTGTAATTRSRIPFPWKRDWTLLAGR